MLTQYRRASTAIACVFALASGRALSQEEGTTTPLVERIAEVVVTGTRVAREGYDAPTPLTVVDEQWLQTRTPSVLIDALKLLPASRNTSTPTTASTGVQGSGGQSFVNLRGLGPNRTLVLLNGQRVVASTATGTADIALLPEALVDRVEVVTGGASSAYGSDAVAGVVNFMLDTNFDGFKGEVQAGSSSRGDADSRKASVAWGGGFGERLHLVASGEYYENDGVDPVSRGWAVGPVATINNPSFAPGNGEPRILLRRYVYLSNAAFGGVITNGPLRGTEFLRGGATRQFASCQFSNAAVELCDSPRDDRGDTTDARMLASPQERGTGYARMTLDVSSDVSVFADALYADSETRFTTIPHVTAFFGPITIQRDNAFLPAAVRDQMAELEIDSFTLGRFSRDNGYSQISRRAVMRRFSTGLEADLSGGWKFDVYATHGETRLRNTIGNFPIIARFNQAVNSVVGPDGQPICRSTLTNPNDGCVPVNVFGDRAPSAAALAYYLGKSQADLTSEETAIAANLAGEPFSTWAGAVSVAVGGEYRRGAVHQVVDPISLSRGFISNLRPLEGKINVKEAYVETVVPLASDVRFARNLETNAAVRLTDYSTSGRVNTWKIGANYSPADSLRFRATRSRDIRAPNITELFTEGVQQNSAVFDPRNANQQVIVANFVGGNPDLEPEEADTSAAGLVFQPTFLPGFSASIDYYRIKMQGAIQPLSSQEIINRCESGSSALCPLITRDAAGQLTAVRAPFLNVARLTTSGVDLETGYRFDLPAGRVDLRALVNYTDEYVVDDGRRRIDQAGDMRSFALPQWSGDLSVGFRAGAANFLVSGTYVGSGNYQNQLLGLLEPDDVKSVWYLSATAEKTLEISGTRATFFVNGTNLLDQQPPFGFEHDGGNYDRIGRAVKVGVRLSW